MPEFSKAQRIYVATLGTAFIMCVLLQLAGPVMEYLYGPSSDTILISKLASASWFVVIGLALVVGVLQRIGVLPSVKTATAGAGVMPGLRLKSLALWIVIALLLVFLFNFFQGTGSGPHTPSPAVAPNATPLPLRDQNGNLDLVSLLVNWFPMLLLVGVWVFFMKRMKSNKDRQPPDIQ